MVTGLTSTMGPTVGAEKLNKDPVIKKGSDSFFDTILDGKIETKSEPKMPDKLKGISADKDPRKGPQGEADKSKTLLNDKVAVKEPVKKNKNDENLENKTSKMDVDQNKKTDSKDGQQKRTTTERQKVMLKFMDSFESEFSVPREKIVEAMTNLSNSELVSDPAYSADDVIANMDLPADKQEQALAMYLAMLGAVKVLSDPSSDPIKIGTEYGTLSKELSQIGINPKGSTAISKTPFDSSNLMNADDNSYFKPLQGPNPQNWSQEKFTSFQSADGSSKGWMSSKDKQQALNESLDNMNRKFFMQESSQNMMQTQTLQGPELKDSLMRGSEMQASNLMGADRTGLENAKLLNGFENGNADLIGFDPMDLQNANASANANINLSNRTDPSALSVEQQDDLAAKLAALMAATAGLSSISKDSAVNNYSFGENPINNRAEKENLFSSEGLNANSSLGLNPNDLSVNSSAYEGQFNSMGSDSSSKDFESSSEEKQSNSKSQNAESSITAAAAGLATGKALHGKDFKLSEPQGAILSGPVTDQQNQQNLQSIMKQAQYLIKRGGGEAKVQMNPDGLGPVQIRVLVEEGGKLNVELSAKTKEAKLALEDSMADLKSKLHEHKYSVESIRVDLSSDIKSELGRHDSQKLQEEFKNLADFKNQQQQQEQSRQFLQQFHQENLFKRDTAWDINNPNGYRSQPQQLQPLKPASGQGISAQGVGRYKGISKGQGLDLVA